jgi:putative hemolysin
VAWLDADLPPQEIRRQAAESRHSFFPVAREDLDDLLGIASVKDAWSREASGEPADLLDSLRPAPLVPEGAPATDALEAFKRSGLPIALLIDERGHIEGLVTLTDVLEALVGEVPDGDRPAEEQIVRREDGSWLVDGLLPADELKERLRLSALPREEEADYQTVGGMVMDALGRVPEEGARFEWEGHSFEVVDMDGRRVDKVLVSPTREVGAPEELS